MVNAYVPNNLNLEKFLADKPPGFKYHIDNFRYIISLITEIPAHNKDLLDRYNFVPINAQELQSRIHDYKKYIDYLLQNGIFQTDNHYIVDEKSKGYRFTAPYRTLVIPEKIDKYSLVKSLTNTSKFDFKMEKKYRYLRQWFNESLKIDYSKAMDYNSDQLKYNFQSGIENAQLKFNISCLNANRLKDHDAVKNDSFF